MKFKEIESEEEFLELSNEEKLEIINYVAGKLENAYAEVESAKLRLPKKLQEEFKDIYIEILELTFNTAMTSNFFARTLLKKEREKNNEK